LITLNQASIWLLAHLELFSRARPALFAIAPSSCTRFLIGESNLCPSRSPAS